MTPVSPLVVVGGGPAGMAAAIEAARAGLSCTLIDEAPRLGGQIYRQPPPEFAIADAARLGKDFSRGERLRSELAEVADRVEVLSRTLVHGVWNGRELLWSSEGASGLTHAERLVLATGAYDRPVPFPGWTLPGVLTAGGAQTLLRTMRIRPGRRAVIAGTGLLLPSLANRLQESGTEIVAVLEAGASLWSPERLLKDWGEWEFARDAWDAWQELGHAGIPFLPHHTVLEAYGREGVEGVSYGPVDAQSWSPLRDQAITVEADLVVLGFGFVPRTELSELAGCGHEHVPELGGWVPIRNASMQTTLPGVFAAGDGAGVAGPLAAELEGRIAGITIAEQAGHIRTDEAESRREPLMERLRSLRRVRKALDEASRIRPGLSDLVTPETLLCRCEEVLREEIDGALREGARDLQAVKLLTRLGMGQCQGRNCAPSTALYMECALEQGAGNFGRINPRPPVVPVTLGTLARMQGVNEGAADPLDAIPGGGS
jgi:NADPH-dependent 2,4-dienoyl-CoA reductase/sulfur reductase-like enzyme